MMTRADALNKARWKFMEIAAEHEIRIIVALWVQDYSVAEITEAMNFTRDRNAEALSEAMQQVEQLIDAESEWLLRVS